MSEKSTLSFRSSVTVTLEITRSYRSAARLGIPNQEAPVDATIVGIVDEKQG